MLTKRLFKKFSFLTQLGQKFGSCKFSCNKDNYIKTGLPFVSATYPDTITKFRRNNFFVSVLFISALFIVESFMFTKICFGSNSHYKSGLEVF